LSFEKDLKFFKGITKQSLPPEEYVPPARGIVASLI